MLVGPVPRRVGRIGAILLGHLRLGECCIRALQVREHLGSLVRLLLKQLYIKKQEASLEGEEFVDGLDVGEHLLEDGAASRVLLELVEDYRQVVGDQRSIQPNLLAHSAAIAGFGLCTSLVDALLELLELDEERARFLGAALHEFGQRNVVQHLRVLLAIQLELLQLLHGALELTVSERRARKLCELSRSLIGVVAHGG